MARQRAFPESRISTCASNPMQAPHASFWIGRKRLFNFSQFYRKGPGITSMFGAVCLARAGGRGGRFLLRSSGIASAADAGRLRVSRLRRRDSLSMTGQIVYDWAVMQEPNRKRNVSLAMSQSVLAKLINLLLLLLCAVATFFCFFAVQELLLTVAAYLIYHGMDSAVRQRYALITARNVWLIAGGALLVGLMIGGFDYFLKRLAQTRTRRRLVLILLAETGIIALSRVVAG